MTWVGNVAVCNKSLFAWKVSRWFLFKTFRSWSRKGFNQTRTNFVITRNSLVAQRYVSLIYWQINILGMLQLLFIVYCHCYCNMTTYVGPEICVTHLLSKQYIGNVTIAWPTYFPLSYPGALLDLSSQYFSIICSSGNC